MNEQAYDSTFVPVSQATHDKRLSIVHLEAQGDLLAVKWKLGDIARSGGGDRGAVTEFSAGSRRRLIRKISRLQANTAVFLTLTYPDRFPGGKTAKCHLRALLERLRRRFPKCSAVWRLEYQKRGAPHFHLILFDFPFVPHKTFRRWWAEIIDEYIDDYLPHVRLEFIRSKRGVQSYVSKYVAKMPDVVVSEESEASEGLFNTITYLHAGRWWGVFNKACIPLAALAYVQIRIETGRGFWDCKRFMRKIWPHLTTNAHRGGVVFTSQSYRAFNHLVTLLLSDVNDEWGSELVTIGA